MWADPGVSPVDSRDWGGGPGVSHGMHLPGPAESWGRLSGLRGVPGCCRLSPSTPPHPPPCPRRAAGVRGGGLVHGRRGGRPLRSRHRAAGAGTALPAPPLRALRHPPRGLADRPLRARPAARRHLRPGGDPPHPPRGTPPATPTDLPPSVVPLPPQMGYDGLFVGRVDEQDKAAREQRRELELLWRASGDLPPPSADIFTGGCPRRRSPGGPFPVLRVTGCSVPSWGRCSLLGLSPTSGTPLGARPQSCDPRLQPGIQPSSPSLPVPPHPVPCPQSQFPPVPVSPSPSSPVPSRADGGC